MTERINIEAFLEKTGSIPVIDVRTPAEFEQGHIPGAINIPLFSNEERAVVGTSYKKQGKEIAILQGLEFIGPKLKKTARDALKIAKDKKLLVHCWRGGMRSESMAWLFSTVGIHSYILEGGYKAFRRFGKQQLKEKGNILVLGGMTGSGKTELLHLLKEHGEQVIDLEGLAHHKGSAFGALGETPQPTTEQFENELIMQWLALNPLKPIWLEDESKSVGSDFIPDELFLRMRKAPVIFLDIPKKERIRRLVIDYANFDKNMLIFSVEKIQKRLGGQHAKTAIEAIKMDDYSKAIDVVLTYYDKTYQYGLNKRDPKKVHHFPIEYTDFEQHLERLLEYAATIPEQ